MNHQDAAKAEPFVPHIGWVESSRFMLQAPSTWDSVRWCERLGGYVEGLQLCILHLPVLCRSSVACYDLQFPWWTGLDEYKIRNILLLLVIDSIKSKCNLDAIWEELLKDFGYWNNIRLPEGSVNGCTFL